VVLKYPAFSLLHSFPSSSTLNLPPSLPHLSLPSWLSLHLKLTLDNLLTLHLFLISVLFFLC
jgi:hypothetical protein